MNLFSSLIRAILRKSLAEGSLEVRLYAERNSIVPGLGGINILEPGVGLLGGRVLCPGQPFNRGGCLTAPGKDGHAPDDFEVEAHSAPAP
jgi:hypothetical protein